MDLRQAQLFRLVVENHISTAQPVGSKFLVEKSDINWSEATVRNELRTLEEEGYLTHPHTSAGRIPTIKGYRFYINNLEDKDIFATRQEEALLKKAAQTVKDYEGARKNLAKELVELSQETVLVAFSKDLVYYTGLSNLFSKPDFGELGLVADISQVFDRCEECLPDFFETVAEEPKSFLGGEHPFGSMLAVVSARFGRHSESLIALLGPLRMNYKHNMGLMKKVKEII